MKILELREIAGNAITWKRLRITSDGHLPSWCNSQMKMLLVVMVVLRFINSGDIQDGDQRALVFRSTNNTAQLKVLLNGGMKMVLVFNPR